MKLRKIFNEVAVAYVHKTQKVLRVRPCL